MDRTAVIYFSLDAWSSYFKRPHHLVREISNLGIDTTYVESCPSLNRRLSFLFRNIFCRFSETRKVQDNLVVLTIHLALPYHPLWIPPFLKNAIIHFNKFLWSMVIKNHLRKYCDKNIIFVISGLLTYPSIFLGSRRERQKNNITLAVYDCLDILEEFPNTDKQIIRYWERRVIHEADAVFVSARNLADRAVMHDAKRIQYVPNGVEFGRFQQAQKASVTPPDIMQSKKQGYYLLGYVGALDEWIDFELMDKVLGCNDRIVLCVVGKCISPRFVHTLERWSCLLKIKYGERFQYLGPKPYFEIPYYVQSFDLCLIPFKYSKLLAGVNPIKLYEYLACGKGVISSYWPEISEFNDVISFVHSDKDVAQAIQRELKRLNDPMIRSRRLKIAASYDWHIIVKRALEALER